MLIERMPAKDAFFSRGNIIFLIVITIIEIIVFYFTLSKKSIIMSVQKTTISNTGNGTKIQVPICRCFYVKIQTIREFSCLMRSWPRPRMFPCP